MSTILDALQRAEAERQGRVTPPEPVLREGDREAMAQALKTATAPEIWSDLRERASPGARLGLGRLMTGLAILGVLAAAVWTWKSLGPGSSVGVERNVEPKEAPQATLPEAAPATPSPSTNLTVEPPMAAPSPAVASPPAAPTASSASMAAARLDMKASTLVAVPQTPRPSTGPRPSQPVPPTSEKPDDLRPIESLSAAERQALGPLQVQGVVQSAQAASRLLMINGLILREGEAVSPSLTLERITPEGAELRWKGPRDGAGPLASGATPSPRLLLSLPTSNP